ncbi:hypothetical protein ACFWN2_11155 [Lentzea sp. NPDC058436]|uniref:hypothetical protein n=1 Tax=Lentzea sp. NPDC058436 TaxID=3346499 RepID=UPI0036582827
MPTISLYHEDSRAEGNDVVGVVRILDDQLVVVTTSLLRARAGVPVDLSPGRYFVDGWSPQGERYHGVIETADTHAVVHVDRAQSTSDVEESALQPWSFNGRAWVRGVSRWNPDANAVVWTPMGGASKVFVVPGLDGLRATGTGVGLRPGLAATLLGYLHRGDRLSAGVVARETQSLQPGANFPAEVVAGYHLVNTGDPGAAEWIEGLRWRYPDSTDVVVLDAQLMLRKGLSEATSAFRRAATSGLPFVGDGLRVMSAGLEAVGAEPLVRPYLLAQQDSPLTSFWGSDPAAPRREIGPSTWPRAENLREQPETRPGPSGTRQAEPVVRAYGLPLAVLDDHRLTVVAAPSEREPNRFDLDITAEGRAATSSGFGLGVREPGVVRLGEFDDLGVCRIRDMGPGPWDIVVCQRRAGSLQTDSVVPLPVVRSAAEVLAAAGANADEVLRARTPSQLTTLVLRCDRARRFFLEATRPPGVDAVAIGVEYGTTNGATALRVMPYPVNEWGRRGLRIEFDDFDANERWQVAEELTVGDIARITAVDLIPSLTASLTPEVSHTWRELTACLPQSHQALIERLVG